MEHNLLRLPLDILKKIFGYVMYRDISNLRLVNRFLYEKCGPILNDKFLSLQTHLEKKLLSIEIMSKSMERNFCSILFHYKALKILLSEFHALRSVCGRYSARGYWCFSAGIILDRFYSVLSVEETCAVEHAEIMKIFLLCDEFMDHFEDIIEPIILKKICISQTAFFGTKVIDILECYINSNFHLIVTYDGDFCHLAGKYETIHAASVLAPPRIANAQSGIASPEDLKVLVRYMRNSVRWNNLMYWIELCCNIDNVRVLRKNRRTKKFSLKLPQTRQNEDVTSAGDHGSMVRKIFKRLLGKRETPLGLSFTVDLQCENEFSPLRLEPYIFELSSKSSHCFSNRSNQSIVSCGLSEVPNFSNHDMQEKVDIFSLVGEYEFSMEMKVRHYAQRIGREQLKESVLQLYQTKEHCMVNEFSKLVMEC